MLVTPIVVQICHPLLEATSAEVEAIVGINYILHIYSKASLKVCAQLGSYVCPLFESISEVVGTLNVPKPKDCLHVAILVADSRRGMISFDAWSFPMFVSGCAFEAVAELPKVNMEPCNMVTSIFERPGLKPFGCDISVGILSTRIPNHC